MKKQLFLISALALPLFITGCDEINNINKETEKIAFKNSYDISAISGINMLNTLPSGLKLANTLEDSEKEYIIDNLKIVENLIENGFVKSQESISDKEEYQTMYTIEATNFDGTVDTYVFYYNEDETIIEQEDNEDDEDEENEIETTIKMSGLVVKDGVEYSMEGSKEVENDEIEITFKIALDENNFIVVEQEVEENETEYSYTKYSDNKKVFETSLEYEISKDNKIEFEFEKKENNQKVEYKYEFLNKKDGKYIDVKIKENKTVTHAYIKVEVIDGITTYTFVENK